MKKLLIILFFPIFCYAQSVPVSPNSFGTVADLRAQVGTPYVQVLLNGLTTINDQNGGTYMWDATNVSADNGFTVIQVTGVTTGRWIRLGNSNTIKGSTVLSGVLLTTAYTVAYPTTLNFTPITVIVCPRSANAAVPSWVSSITNTNFTVNFASVPVVGTNNIAIDYIIVKQ